MSVWGDIFLEFGKFVSFSMLITRFYFLLILIFCILCSVYVVRILHHVVGNLEGGPKISSFFIVMLCCGDDVIVDASNNFYSCKYGKSQSIIIYYYFFCEEIAVAGLFPFVFIKKRSKYKCYVFNCEKVWRFRRNTFYDFFVFCYCCDRW